MRLKLLPIILSCAIAAIANVQDDFLQRRSELGISECFPTITQEMDSDLCQALEFLYAYMPLPDITDYEPEYFIENVRLALQVRREMPWGLSIPDREWRHFVLPLRVNNEPLDDHRKAFYPELKERVEGMTMEEAILEINHWCHEKVTYEPSDARTHSPLQSVSSGIGRCGEESTFTVAALRSIGIPARQVYTPRWAHTDDNHAWVEAWADGKWHFLGACEPEAVLDLGWFNAPASRGMLMTTRTPGRYDGPEEKLVEATDYTDINVTSNYAPVARAQVCVVDTQGSPVEDAQVDFCIYNYGEFYPVAHKITDSNGMASIESGLGDLIVWVSKDGTFDLEKLSVSQSNDPLKITLDFNQGVCNDQELEFELVPPVASTNLPKVSPEASAACELRKAQEDSIRKAYVGTFVSRARGNQATIDAFLQFFEGFPLEQRSQKLRDSLCDKDMTDIPLYVMFEAMLTPQFVNDSLYLSYVLQPRVELEFLKENRFNLSEYFSEEDQTRFRNNPRELAKWYANAVDASQTWQPATVRMDPMSTTQWGKSNAVSRDIALVAMARALGIPARIDQVTGKPQYFDAEGQCYDFWISDSTGEKAPEGKLQLTYEAQGYVQDPEYYTHFTISKIADGKPQLLNYDEGESWKQGFAQPRPIDAGEYMLVSGQRLANGSVLAQVEFFKVNEGELTTVPLVLRQDNEGVKVIGSFNSEDMYYDLAYGAEKSILSTTGRGYYVLGLMAIGQEPSNHALRDISAVATELETTGRPMLLLFPSVDDATAWQAQNNLQMPSTVSIGADANGAIRKELAETLHLANSSLPIVVIADTFNRVVFVSEGYTIGLGRQLIETLKKLEE